ncbi:PorP/SprF family type IX secretion system membrane protein [Flagellimonas sp. S3867]|uniref:PorP/SprF family type IX secretion system membrane protein n=1 Tax=Flagellimonas sp. S3867 TaxID=2768063 RepID=UPI001689CA7F|nr:PorP/SprF family type IX secretion system membrane protein [Flagellimonas sp. S3867]
MPKPFVSIVFLLSSMVFWAQEINLPADFRQHNLTQFNSSLLNATYGLDWNNPNSLSVWSRWQWQTIDGDPTSLFANYSHGINQNSSFGIGFLQHNTGVYLNTGANLNYVHAIALDGVQFIFGMNVFGFQQEVADEALIPDPNPSEPENPSDFIIAVSPAIRLQADGFGLGLAVENAVDFNLSNSDSEEDAIGYVGTLSYDFPVTIFSGLGNSMVRPVVYVKSISDADTQFGINALLSTSKFWVQGGFNNFYGPSGGVGVTIAKQFSIGGLMEFGTEWPQSGEDPTLEIIASYHIGKSDARKKVVGFDVEKEEELALERLKTEEEQRQLEAQKLAEAEAAEQRARTEQQKLAEEKRLEAEQQQLLLAKQARERDSIAQASLVALKLREEQRKKDSIARLQQQTVEVKPNERYEEVTNAEGLEPGFYLIANVFGTKRYFESFMLTLKKKGLEPKSFYRTQNKFNYVYLQRYNTMQEARRARDSKFFGKYPDKTWIFRVRNE